MHKIDLYYSIIYAPTLVDNLLKQEATAHAGTGKPGTALRVDR